MLGLLLVEVAVVNCVVEVPIVIAPPPIRFAPADAGAAVEVVETVIVSAASPAPVYAVFDVPMPSQAARITVTYLSLASVLRIDDEVAFAPGAARLTAIPANFSLLNVEPDVEVPTTCTTSGAVGY